MGREADRHRRLVGCRPPSVLELASEEVDVPGAAVQEQLLLAELHVTVDHAQGVGVLDDVAVRVAVAHDGQAVRKRVGRGRQARRSSAPSDDGGVDRGVHDSFEADPLASEPEDRYPFEPDLLALVHHDPDTIRDVVGLERVSVALDGESADHDPFEEVLASTGRIGVAEVDHGAPGDRARVILRHQHDPVRLDGDAHRPFAVLLSVRLGARQPEVGGPGRHRPLVDGVEPRGHAEHDAGVRPPVHAVPRCRRVGRRRHFRQLLQRALPGVRERVAVDLRSPRVLGHVQDRGARAVRDAGDGALDGHDVDGTRGSRRERSLLPRGGDDAGGGEGCSGSGGGEESAAIEGEGGTAHGRHARSRAVRRPPLPCPCATPGESR